jgi:hypothetical protein
MKLLKDNRAQIRIIEAFFASILILGAVALIPSQPPSTNENQNTLNLKGQDVLATLDRNGFLAKLIENGSWIALKKSVESSLSPAVWFNLTVFDENMRPINEIPICSGSPISEKITASDYVCANTARNYEIYIIRLQLSSVT